MAKILKSVAAIAYVAFTAASLVGLAAQGEGIDTDRRACAPALCFAAMF